MSDKNVIAIPVIYGKVLGVKVLRGFAKLKDLASASQADIYDPKKNPNGTQRDLSPKHAKDAYDYVKSKEIGFWPEVFLCARNKEVLKFKYIENQTNIGTLYIDLNKISALTAANKISISRVDGNHRLHYADGMTAGYPPIHKEVSFCLALGLSLEDEISLFRDINDNQRRMNTSHLDNIESRLSGEDKLKRASPALYIAKTLGEDRDSPLYQRIYDGGSRAATSLVPLRSLKSGMEYMMSRPTKLTALPDTDAKYKVIKNYFLALKKWIPEAWNEPKKYLMLRGAGLWGVCFLGAEVIDRALSKGEFSPDSMLKVLKSGRNWDWTVNGDFQGYSGRGGATKIRDQIVSELADDSGPSVKDLYRQIMKE